MMKPEEVLSAIAAVRGDAICVPTMTTAPAWRKIAPGDLSVGCVGFMGGASAMGLGLALGAPERRVIVFDGDKQISVLHPEKRLYTVQQSVMTEAGIDAGFTRDLYVALGEPLDNGAWAVRVHVKPFVRWIWLGGLLMGFGGLLAAFDRRYRVKVKTRVREALGMAGAQA